jgi:predicted RNase H-like nuclease (RuvC/YqgF family)
MTPETGPSPLTAARRRDVAARRARVARALAAMRAEGIQITISSVAARARVHRSFIHRHLDLRADVYAAADQPSVAGTATTTTRQSLEADNLNLRATVRRQTQHIADLEARLSELLGEQAYSRTGLGAPRNHAALEEQNHTLQNEIQELQAKLQDQEEELGAAREANRQLIGQLNKTAASDDFDGRRGTIQQAAHQD